MDVTLYQSEPDPYSHRVRHQLSAHGVDYELVNVPRARDDRHELERATGQRSIPALVINGRVHTTPEGIGQAIADHWPRDHEDLGDIELWEAPVQIVVLDCTSDREAQARLEDAFAELEDVELDEATTTVPGVVRTFELVGSHLEDMVSVEPRVRALLPLRIVLVERSGGLVALVPLPVRLVAPLHNLALISVAEDLQQRIVDSLHRVARASNV